MLEFEKGQQDSPTGNLLVYCHVRGFNPVQPGGRIIVCNVVVSFVSAPSNQFPVVIFPPASLPSESELRVLQELHDYYDVIRVSDFEVPAGTDENIYIKERLDDFNNLVMDYMELCRASVQRELEFFETEDEDYPAFEPGIFRIQDEESALDRLETLLGTEENGSETEESREIDRLIRFLETHHPRYDIKNLRRVLNSGMNRELPRLYLRKFRAIYDEKYEEAATLHNRILALEKNRRR